ncbi:MAG: divalent-cation tolerance protein CutA [Candidatus Omnitrophica bacterium]|nr:divalent-cation tolerance protein CutA [Candidatus Omnitrophota bacterium]
MAAPAVVLLLCTTPTPAAARRLARGLLARRLAACVSCLPGADSRYWWNGRIERARETVMLIKTTRPRVGAAMRDLAKHHPYTVPELIAVPIVRGGRPYLRWLRETCRG